METKTIEKPTMAPDGSHSDSGGRHAPEATSSRGPRPLQSKVGFIGIGHMGTAMAANLAAVGHRVELISNARIESKSWLHSVSTPQPKW